MTPATAGSTDIPRESPIDALPDTGVGAIGVFDSGLGGLSVAREIRRYLPHDSIHYLGDNGHIPYGPRPVEEVQAFSVGAARFLIENLGCRCIVVACNTATSAAAPLLRETFSHIPIVAMEPGIKPAAQQTHTGKVAVLATIGTLAGSRLAHLVERFAGGIEVITQPCPGWVECVEAGDLNGPVAREAVSAVILPLIEQGVDTLILGCTHYPFLAPLIAEIAPPEISIIDTGPAVARRVAAVLPEMKGPASPNTTFWNIWTTGDREQIKRTAKRCLQEGFRDVNGVYPLYWSEKGNLIPDSP